MITDRICVTNHRRHVRFATMVATSVLLAGWHLAMAQASPPHRGAQSLQNAATTVFNGKIAFMSTRIASTTKIFTVNADGSGVTCLMCTGGSDPSGTGSTDTRSGDQPAFSPDGNTIAFVRSGGIWLMDSDGGNQRSIAPGSNPAWSPDGTRMVFTLNTGGNNEIFIMNADGSGQINITNNVGNDVLPAWGAVLPNHPQGRISFRSSRTGNSEIYVIAPTSLAETFQSSPLFNVTNNAAFDSSAKWSADGRKLVFISNRDSANNEVYTLDLDTNVLTRLTTDSFVDDTPTWSPDGTSIAYTSFRSGSNEIIVINSSSGVPVTPPALGNITNNAASDASPSWGVTPVVASADLSMQSVVDDPDPVSEGSNYGYIVTFKNLGPSVATGLKIVIDQSANVRGYVGAGCSTAIDRRVTCTIAGTLANGATLQWSIPFTAILAGAATVKFTVSSNETDPVPSNNFISATTTVSPAALFALTFDGRLRDRVGMRETINASPADPDGSLDGTFTMSLPGSISPKTITKLDLVGPNGNHWDTVPNNGLWVVGIADSLDINPSTGQGGLLNQANGSISFVTGYPYPDTFKLFVPDSTPSSFLQNNSFTLTASFADGTSAVGSVKILKTQADVGVAFATPPPTTVRVGDDVTFAIRVNNNGPETAKGVTFDGFIDVQFNTVGVSSSECTVTGRQVHCDFGSIDTGPVGATSGTSVRLINITARASSVGLSLNRMFESVDLTNTIDNNNANAGVSASIKVNPKAVVELIGLEVTQGVQNLNNTIPLVAGKTTFVRAHVQALSASSDSVKATAMLSAKNVTTGASLGDPIPNTNTPAAIKILQSKATGGSVGTQRINLDDSFYFQLPPEWSKNPGSVEFTFAGNEFPIACNEPDAVKDCKVTVQFRARRNFSIKFVMTTFIDAAGKSHAPTNADLIQAMTEIRTSFPMADFANPMQTTWTTKQEYCTLAGLIQMKTDQIAMRAADCDPDLTNTNPRTCRSGVEDFHYMLLANPFDEGLCGGAGYITGIAQSLFDGDGIKTDNSGNSAVAIAREANTRAHELGHAFGLRHTFVAGTPAVQGADDVKLTGDGTMSPANKADYDPATYFGFDTFRATITGLTSGNNSYVKRASRVYSPNAPDMMSYGGNAWPSAYKYTRLFNALAPTSADAPGVKAATSTTQVLADKLFAIDGLVSFKDGTGHIGNVYSIDSTGIVTLPPPGEYALRFEDAVGTVLATYSFKIGQFSEGDVGGFGLRFPKDPAARRIVLLRNGQVLDTRVASANSPTITVVSPNGGETLSGPTSNFTWSAADADGDPLTFAVEYSIDGGVIWSMLTTNWKETTYPVDLTRLQGSNRALIRVTASDGFNSAQARSNATFIVSGHAPLASIIAPVNNQLYVGDQMIIFQGIGLDVEDGLLADASMTWSSSLNGTLGTGAPLAVKASSLSEGTHTITLRAQDSSNAIGTTTITVRIARIAPIQPDALAFSTLGLDFVAPSGGASIPTQELSIRDSGDGELAFTATADQSWIKLNVTSGTTPLNPQVSVDPTGLAPGSYAGKITIVAPGAANTPQVISVNLVIPAPSAVRIDIDGNNSYDALTDGLLTIRYLFGLTGAPLTNGAIGSGSARTSPTDIVAYLDTLKPNLDVDGNGTSDALSDGLMIIRYLFGLRGQALIAGAVGAGATRTTAAEIEAYLQSLLPQ